MSRSTQFASLVQALAASSKGRVVGNRALRQPIAAEAATEVGVEPIRQRERAVRTFKAFRRPVTLSLVREDNGRRYKAVFSGEITSVYRGRTTQYIQLTIDGKSVKPIMAESYERLGEGLSFVAFTPGSPSRPGRWIGKFKQA